MSVLQSQLSSAKYDYDFVVATTQASINAGLLEYLHKVQQDETILCYLADENSSPTIPITLAKLREKTGYDPFLIPDQTSTNDPRIVAFTQAGFQVGLKLRLGLPPGVRPTELTVVDLGSSANNVRFNLYCSEVTIIENVHGALGHGGRCNVYTQKAGAPWYFATNVNLVYKNLDKQLNDSAYFRNNPAEKARILAQLVNLGSMAFSLQQLLSDLDNAILQSLPRAEGFPPNGSNALIVLQRTFDSKWSLAPGQSPQSVLFPDAGAEVLVISYESNADASDKSGATYAELDLRVSYTCTVSFAGQKITIAQRMVVWMKAQFDLTSTSGNIVDRTVTDDDTLAVDQHGDLQVQVVHLPDVDHSQSIDLSGIITWFVDMNDMIHSITNRARTMASTQVTSISASTIRNVVFPAGQVFAFRNPRFSEFQDLVTDITYVTPS